MFECFFILIVVILLSFSLSLFVLLCANLSEMVSSAENYFL